MPQDERFPKVPSWKTELRQLAPNVYAYTQASGPGIDNASLSNAGVIVGDDLLAIDALGPRFTPKPSSPVPSGPPASRSAGWSTPITIAITPTETVFSCLRRSWATSSAA